MGWRPCNWGALWGNGKRVSSAPTEFAFSIVHSRGFIKKNTDLSLFRTPIWLTFIPMEAVPAAGISCHLLLAYASFHQKMPLFFEIPTGHLAGITIPPKHRTCKFLNFALKIILNFFLVHQCIEEPSFFVPPLRSHWALAWHQDCIEAVCRGMLLGTGFICRVWNTGSLQETTYSVSMLPFFPVVIILWLLLWIGNFKDLKKTGDFMTTGTLFTSMDW